jgi:hypothetical protein
LTRSARPLSAKDLDRAAAVVAENAGMDSRAAGAKVSKAEWRAAVQRVMTAGQWPTSLEYQVSSVSFSDPTQATVRAGLVALQVNGRRTQDRQEVKVEKRDGRWVIVEARYLQESLAQAASPGVATGPEAARRV